MNTFSEQIFFANSYPIIYMFIERHTDVDSEPKKWHTVSGVKQENVERSSTL